MYKITRFKDGTEALSTIIEGCSIEITNESSETIAEIITEVPPVKQKNGKYKIFEGKKVEINKSKTNGN